MALQYILQQLGYKMGKSPSVPREREVLLRFARSAAKELYDTSDMAGSLSEEVFRVNSNQTIAFPDYMGDIRAMRESGSHIALKLSQMRPRYNEYNWVDEWRNWRVKGLQPLQVSIRNQSQLTLTVKAVENPPMVVTIVGPTDGAAATIETITMTAVSMTTVNAFNDVSAFTKTAVSEYDVCMNDASGNQVSFIPNNKIQAKFQIIDVSAAPWFYPNTNPLCCWVEVLYKKSLPWLQNDSDEFPAIGYDDVMVNKGCQLWAEEQGNIQLAIATNQKCMQLLAQIHENANRGTDDVVALVENPHFQMQHRVGFGRDWRYAYRIIGR